MISRERILILLCFLFNVSIIQSHEVDSICVSPDRSTVCAAPYVIPKGHLQLESGVEFDFGNSRDIVLPTAMLRWGITQYAELRVQYEGNLGKGDRKWSYEVNPLIFGTKLKFFEGRNWIPEIGFLGHLSIPVSKGSRVAPQLYFLFENDLGKGFTLDYNIGSEWNGQDNIPTALLSFCASYSINKVGVYVESANRILRNSEKHTECSSDIDFGCNYLVSNNVQLDMYAGFNCQHPKDCPFVGMGISWLIK